MGLGGDAPKLYTNDKVGERPVAFIVGVSVTREEYKAGKAQSGLGSEVGAPGMLHLRNPLRIPIQRTPRK